MLAQPGSQPISIVAGDIEINNAIVSSTAGDIRLAAVGTGPQEIGFTGTLPAIAGNLKILDGGGVLSTPSSHDTGSVKLGGGDITIDGLGNSSAGIFTVADFGGTGNAGSVVVSATGNLSITNGGFIRSATTSSGNAANIDVSAMGALSISKGGAIGSNALDLSGNAGAIKVMGGRITIDGLASFATTGIFSNTNSRGNAGTVDVSATGSLAITNGGLVSSCPLSSGSAGAVKVRASDMTINTGGLVLSGAFPNSTGNAGNIDVSLTGNLSIATGGGTPRATGILASTAASGNAGTVTVSARNITIDGQGSDLTGIESAADLGSSGKAGSVELLVPGNLSVVNGGVISTNTFSSGDAGTIKVRAGSITIDGKGVDRPSSISSLAQLGSTGHAGSVDVWQQAVFASATAARSFRAHWARAMQGRSRSAPAVLSSTNRQASLARQGLATRGALAASKYSQAVSS